METASKQDLSNKTTHNNVFASSGVDAKSNVFVSLMRSVSGTGRGFESPARTQILTLAVMPWDELNPTIEFLQKYKQWTKKLTGEIL
jgi:hypothetical protein